MAKLYCNQDGLAVFEKMHRQQEAALSSVLRQGRPGLRINEHLDYPGDLIFRHACKMGLEGIVSRRLGSYYRSGWTQDWIKFKNPEAPAVKREAEEDWSR
jgi:ATP-dependent DNA ligase